MGAGKSHFLKCWIGEHLKTHDNTEMLYFDAFAHDYLDDPLVALTGALAERLEAEDVNVPATVAEKAVSAVRKIVPFVSRTALRMGVAYLTAGLVNRADEMLGGTDEENDDAKNTSSGVGGVAGNVANEAIDGFWAKETGKQKAVEGFHAALKGLTEPDENGSPTRRLVVVVDELDRCRPDYALNLLEIIKHFFNVEGVHFVLGINQRAMQNHVIARYGAGIDAALYLQKFVQLTMRLGNKVGNHIRDPAYRHYFSHIYAQMGLGDGYASYVKEYVDHLSGSTELTLRGLQQLARLCAVTPWPSGWHERSREINLISGLLYLEAMHPDIIVKMRDKKLEWTDIQKSLSPTSLVDGPRVYNEISEAWLLCFRDQKTDAFWREYLGDDYRDSINSYSRDTPRQLLEQYLGSISIKDL